MQFSFERFFEMIEEHFGRRAKVALLLLIYAAIALFAIKTIVEIVQPPLELLQPIIFRQIPKPSWNWGRAFSLALNGAITYLFLSISWTMLSRGFLKEIRGSAKSVETSHEKIQAALEKIDGFAEEYEMEIGGLSERVATLERRLA